MKNMNQLYNEVNDILLGEGDTSITFFKYLDDTISKHGLSNEQIEELNTYITVLILNLANTANRS